jgi:hypothetical protein
MRRMVWMALLACTAWSGPVAAQSTVPAGTVLPVTLDETVSLELKDAGKSYRARLARAVTLAGGTVIPAGAPARVTTTKPAGKPKQAQAVLAEITVGGKAYAVPSQAARIEASAAASGQASAAGAVGVKVKGSQASGPTYVNVSSSAKRLNAGSKLRFALSRSLSLQ